MRIYLSSIGCRLNQSEIETMARQLLANGHEIVPTAAQADTVVINTCAVTSSAARDARKQTRQSFRENPAAEVLLTGCYATIAPGELAQLKGAGRIVANKDKPSLVQLIDPEIKLDAPIYEQEPILREFLAGGAGNTRAFIKAQDGCDNRCTFCVTTIARGAGTSRHLGDIVAEVQALTAAGYQEAVLSGVHLGSYGRDLDQPDGLKQLIAAILAHTDIRRLRLSSLEPWEIADGFFELWANPRLLPHLHLPLQSGSDKILRRMARRTSRATFRALVADARAHIPDLNLSTDIIAGFPGETEADFTDSLDFVEEIGFSRLHVFPYSPRPGTAAAGMAGHLTGAVKKDRVRRMITLGERLGRAYYQRQLGQIRPVLWERLAGADDDGVRWLGYSDNYIRVSAHSHANLMNVVTPVELCALGADGITGRIVAPVNG